MMIAVHVQLHCTCLLGSEVLHKCCLTLFDMGGGHDGPPQNVFAHFAQTLRRRKLKLGDF